MCAVDRPRLTKFPFMNLYCLMLDLQVASFEELFIFRQDHEHRVIAEEKRLCSYRIA